MLASAVAGQARCDGLLLRPSSEHSCLLPLFRPTPQRMQSTGSKMQHAHHLEPQSDEDDGIAYVNGFLVFSARRSTRLPTDVSTELEGGAQTTEVAIQLPYKDQNICSSVIDVRWVSCTCLCAYPCRCSRRTCPSGRASPASATLPNGHPRHTGLGCGGRPP